MHIEVRMYITQRFLLIQRHTSMHLICSRETHLHVSPSRVRSALWRLFAFHKAHSATATANWRHCRKIAGGAVCKWRMYFSRTSYVFYRFRRRFSTRILWPYHQSNRTTREGRHFHVSGKTSRRLQGKLHEKTACLWCRNARLTSWGFT